MESILEKMLLNLAIPFIFRQVDKYRDQIDWNKVEADLEKKVRDLLPGSFFDDEAVSLLKVILNAVKGAMSQDDALKQIIALLVDKKWADALLALKGFVFSALHLNLLAANDAGKAKELFADLA